MVKKEEIIQLRVSTEKKKELKKRAEDLGLNLSQFIKKNLEKNETILQSFLEIKREINELKEQNDNSFFYIKKDTELIKDLVENKNIVENEDKEVDYYVDKSLDLSDINSYNIEDIIEADNKFFIIKRINLEEKTLIIINLNSLDNSKISIEKHSKLINSLKKRGK